MLFWLHPEHKYHNAAKIDKFISAEIPDPIKDPLGYKIITEYMIHGPCGYAKTNAPCMKNSKCSKKFPKQIKNETTIEENGLVIYRRRDTEFNVMKEGIKLDNRYVVPYNRTLCLKYNAHINVEICSQSMLIKYLFKYLTKGPDRIRAVIEDNVITENNETTIYKEVDEIKAYLNCRYITPYEAIWRIFEYSIHYRNPAVQRLSIHLPNMQNITFNKNQQLQNIIHQPQIQKTTLTEWMEINKTNKDAQELTYTEFPTKWVWNNKNKIWTHRQNGHTIGRTFYIHPGSGELYYLKLLLNHQKGATSFESLRTVNDIIYPTNQMACYALGLLGDDKEWDESIKEASFWSTSVQLRQLFIIILLFCNITDPTKFLEKHWKLMCEDILYNIRQLFNNPNFEIPENELYNYVLYELEKLLNLSSSSLSHYNLPLPTGSLIDDLNNNLLREELNYDIYKLKEENINLVQNLNEEQYFIYNEILKAIKDKYNNLFFIYGYGGTGKTYLWNTIISKIRSNGEIVLAVASSGIASLLLPKGRTAHSRFHIPLSIDEFSTCQIKKSTQLAKLIEKTTLILWDEAPMTNKYCFEALDKTMQDLKNNFDHPFGGMTVILGGDFRQILPVVPNGTKENIIDVTINNSYLWPYFRILTLTENMRLKRNNYSIEEQIEIANFSKWILNVGDGTTNGIKDPENEDATWIKIPEKYLIQYNTNSIEQICTIIYDNFHTNFQDINYLKQRAIITPKNKTTDEINKYLLSLVPTDTKIYYSCDTILSSSGNIEELNLLYPTEFLHTLNFNGLPPHELKLNIGIPVMLMRNLNQSMGLCNGTRMIITQLTNRIVEGRIINSNDTNEKVYIPRIEMTIRESKWPFTLKRR